MIDQQADAAVEPVDATFRRRDALSQVRGLLRVEDRRSDDLDDSGLKLAGAFTIRVLQRPEGSSYQR
jgi:hypothetical protein